MIVYTIITLLLLLNKIQPVIGRIVELQSSSGLDVDCGQDLTSNDTCHIICSVEESLPPNIYCREAGKCIIDCTGYYCLSETNIYASNSSHLALISSAEYCLDLANIYLPNNGNATIIGTESSNAGTVLHQARVYAGTATNYISITCDNPSGKAHLWSCQQLFVDASTAKVLEITVNDADLSDASIRCPVDSALSPSCVIDAFAAESTENLIIYADNGMPQDVEFYSLSTAATNVYKNTRIICTDSSSTINANGNTFVGTPCFITLAPTISDLLPSNLPTKQPTDPPSKLNTEISTISPIITIKPSHSPSGFPTNQPSKYPTQHPHESTSAPTRSSIITNNPTQRHHESTAGSSYVLTAETSHDSTINDVETTADPSSRTQYVQMTTKTESETFSFSNWMNVTIVILTTICCYVSFIWGYTMIKKYIHKKEVVIIQQLPASPPIQQIPSVNVAPGAMQKQQTFTTTNTTQTITSMSAEGAREVHNAPVDLAEQRVRSVSQSSNESMYDHVEEPDTTRTRGE